jgi:hypothetical protein
MSARLVRVDDKCADITVVPDDEAIGSHPRHRLLPDGRDRRRRPLRRGARRADHGRGCDEFEGTLNEARPSPSCCTRRSRPWLRRSRPGAESSCRSPPPVWMGSRGSRVRHQPWLASSTQNRFPSGSARTTKSGSTGYKSHSATVAPSPTRRSISVACSSASSTMRSR